MTRKVNIEKLSAWVLEFTAYSFIGWLYETILTSAVWGRFADRGWLHLPICPLYGFCAVALVLILGKLKSVPLIFGVGTCLTTAAELAASYVFDLFIDDPLWDYDNWRLIFRGVSLWAAALFSVCCAYC